MPRGVESPEAQAKRFARENEEWNRKARESWRHCSAETLVGLRAIMAEQKAEVLEQIAKLAKSAAGIDVSLAEVEGLIREARAREAKAVPA